MSTSSATAVDFDGDGWEDLFLSHWAEAFSTHHFLRNDEGRGLIAYDESLGFGDTSETGWDYGFTANFRDVDGNGYPDLMLAGDFGRTQLWLNQQGRTFVPTDESVFTDENGMGSAVGDFDNDGDEDWIVTAIYDDDGVLEGNWGGSGNRYYENRGQGVFGEARHQQAVQATGWGWGAACGDFDLDGWLDLIVTNGWPRGDDSFKGDLTTLFRGGASGGFTESVGFPADSLQGRGIALLDKDGDGDLDILISNYGGPVKLFENLHRGGGNWFRILPKIAGRIANGSQVRFYAEDGSMQSRHIGESNNYNSNNQPGAHFGIAPGKRMASVVVQWPEGDSTVYRQLAANEVHSLEKPQNEPSISTSPILFPNPVVMGNLFTIRSTFAIERVNLLSVDGQLITTLNPSGAQGENYYFTVPHQRGITAGNYLITFDLSTSQSHLTPIKLTVR